MLPPGLWELLGFLLYSQYECPDSSNLDLGTILERQNYNEPIKNSLPLQFSKMPVLKQLVVLSVLGNTLQI